MGTLSTIIAFVMGLMKAIPAIRDLWNSVKEWEDKKNEADAKVRHDEKKAMWADAISNACTNAADRVRGNTSEIRRPQEVQPAPGVSSSSSSSA